MLPPFSWQTTLDSGVVVGFTGTSFGSLTTPPHESRVDSSTASFLHTQRAELNAVLQHAGYNPVRFMRQTHSCTVLPRTGTETEDALPAEFDGHLNNGGQFSLGVLTADCLPILLAGTNPLGEPVVAAVHAGRVGLLGGIITNAANALLPLLAAPNTGAYTEPVAVIGPAICGRCYEVPESMRREAAAQFSRIASETSWGTPALDLSAAAEDLLTSAGFRTITTGICTLEDPAYYSYRGGDSTDRNAGVVLTPITT